MRSISKRNRLYPRNPSLSKFMMRTFTRRRNQTSRFMRIS